MKYFSYDLVYLSSYNRANCYRMYEILEDVEPFLKDQNLIKDLYSMIVSLESMEIFKNLGLLNVKCALTMFRSSLTLFSFFFSIVLICLFFTYSF